MGVREKRWDWSSVRMPKWARVAHEAVERGGVRFGWFGEFFGGFGAGREEIGEVEFGGDVGDAGDAVGHRHFDEGSVGGRCLGVGH